MKRTYIIEVEETASYSLTIMADTPTEAAKLALAAPSLVKLVQVDNRVVHIDHIAECGNRPVEQGGFCYNQDGIGVACTCFPKRIGSSA